MTGSLGMIFMGNRGTKKSHDAITGELVDGALIFVDLIHEDFKSTVHHLVDFLRVELLRHGCVIGHISEEHRHQFALSLNGAARRQDLISQMFGGVGLGLGEVDWGAYLQFF